MNLYFYCTELILSPLTRSRDWDNRHRSHNSCCINSTNKVYLHFLFLLVLILTCTHIPHSRIPAQPICLHSLGSPPVLQGKLCIHLTFSWLHMLFEMMMVCLMSLMQTLSASLVPVHKSSLQILTNASFCHWPIVVSYYARTISTTLNKLFLFLCLFVRYFGASSSLTFVLEVVKAPPPCWRILCFFSSTYFG